MKLTLLQKDLSPKLLVVNRFVSSRAQLPILSNIKFKTQNNKLFLTATNLEMSICATVPITVETDGEITLPARAVYELVSNMNENIMIEAIGENVKLVSEEFNSSLSGINTADFPEVPTARTGESIKINSNEFAGAVSKVLFSTSPDDTRPALAGILLIFLKDSLTLVSSDGFRLSKVSISMPGSSREDKLILPKLAVTEIAKLITKENKDFSLSYDRDQAQVIFDLGDHVISSRIIEGEYPNFEKIIPQSYSTQASVDKLTLLKHIKTAAVFARDGSGIINLEIDKTEITINAESNKLGTHKSRVPAKVDGDKVEISYNYRYIEEFLNVVSGEDILLEFTNSAAAGVFRDASEKNYLHLIMPVRG